MSVIDTLITDRTQVHVDRLKQLMTIGWQNMTDDEKAEYISGGADLSGVQKGAYNYTDLNRVEEAVDYIADELVQAPTDLQAFATSLGVAWDSSFELPYDENDYTSLTIKTDWTDEDIPNATDMARYLGNLQLIQAALPTLTVAPSSMNALDYAGANAIEQMLKEADTALADAVEYRKQLIKGTLALFYSGELYSGELPMGGDN